MRADGQVLRFIAPSLLVVPATVVHGFSWDEDSSGTVVTMATRYISDLARHDHALARIFDAARALTLSHFEKETAERLVQELMRELAWSAPGHRAAVDATLLSLLVVVLRNATLDDRPIRRPGYYAGIVARLRERIEHRFREREPVSVYAETLGVSETTLRLACSKVAGMSPTQVLNQRALLEARRSLLYTNLTVAEVGYSLGFPDPAYFSRFFSRHVGLSPTDFRSSRSS
ncbi:MULTISPECIES: helix-turn-helix domain-containing protein [Pseudomonadota]|nr:AraC family transcriptional regulator [Sphingomonas bisphenolicum]|tara:strand:- start:1791 stop:2483 length:693 start_codon:yes stop_codon:yes gene_type:complete